MTNEQLIEKMNPANAGNQSPEDLELMRALTDEQIDVLAEAYPNQPTRRSYLRLFDKSVPADKQLYQLSTWQNLRNVRKFSNRKNLIPWDFLTTATKFNQPRPTASSNKVSNSPKKVVVDLTAQEAADELRTSMNIVDKAPGTTTTAVDTKAAKPAASPRKGRGKTSKPAAAPPVNNDELPADQQFTGGE